MSVQEDDQTTVVAANPNKNILPKRNLSLKCVRRQSEVVRNLLTSSNVDLVNKEIATLDNKLFEFAELNTTYMNILNEDESLEAAKLADKVDSEIFEVKKQVAGWLTDIDERESLKSSTNKSRVSSSRNSGKSSGSCRSKDSVASSIQNRADIEGLRMELSLLQDSKDRIVQEKERKISENIDKIEKKLSIAEAKQKVFDKEFVVPENVTVRQKRSQALDSVGNKLVELLNNQSAPATEIDTFTGNILEYEYFRASFVEAVENKIKDDKGRLLRLIKYTSGEPKELVKEFIHGGENCYQLALRALDKEYGNSQRLSAAYLKELKLWPHIKHYDVKGYKAMYRFLLKCKILKNQKQLSSLDSYETLRLIMSKFSAQMQTTWNKVSYKIIEKNGRDVNFADLFTFVEEQSNLVSNPNFSQAAYSDNPKRDSNSFSSFATVHNSSSNSKWCFYCKKNDHHIHACDEFSLLSLVDKQSFIKDNKLCFGCLKSSSRDHFSKICKNRLICEDCGKRHPTILHDYYGAKQVSDSDNTSITGSTHQGVNSTPKVSETSFDDKLKVEVEGQNSNDVKPSLTVSTIVESNNEIVGLSIVPVYVYVKGQFNKKIKVYAMLDMCSQGTFVAENLIEKLDTKFSRETYINVKTINGEESTPCIAVRNLVVCGVEAITDNYGLSEIELPTAYSQFELPFGKSEIPLRENLKEWSYMNDILKYLPDADESLMPGLLIGGNCVKALEPCSIISSKNHGPCAMRTRLGWCVFGPMNAPSEGRESVSCHVVKTSQFATSIPTKDILSGKVSNHHFSESANIKDGAINHFLAGMYNNEFNEVDSGLDGLSIEDEQFLSLMKREVKQTDGHYELPLPLRRNDIVMPNNKPQAEKRLLSVKRKMERSEKFKEEYTKFMENLVDKGYASQCIDSDDQGWYLPHHGVFHPTKGKLRVVFDCAAKTKGLSLNDNLLQGPDLTNTLVGVLIRFRMHPIAFMADIESMFYQVRVPSNQRSYLRFLWWKEGNTLAEPCTYEMNVHIFGAVSSPSCSNFALRQAANDFESKYGAEAAYALRKNFYVDDLLKSVEEETKACSLWSRIEAMCKAGGFNLTKVVSNSEKLISSIPVDKRAQSMQIFELVEKMPLERALGVHWSIENDSFQFRITLENCSLTRRSILSCVSSIYDPLGLVSPFLLVGRKILQEITADKYSWDDPVSEEHQKAWLQWRSSLPLLGKISISRCLKPAEFGDITDMSLHSFSDASLYGYGQATYLRCESKTGKVSVSLIMGKSRVAPIKPITIPRLELSAALLSCRIATLVKKELEMDDITETYWVDSQIVLGYLKNDTRRFKMFVANRVKEIRDHTTKDQWLYVNTKENPGDDASRGLPIVESIEATRWFNGPSFLHQPRESWVLEQINPEISTEDPEVKKDIMVNAISVVKCSSILDRLENISSWQRQKRVVCKMIEFSQRCRKKSFSKEITVNDITKSEVIILLLIQRKYLLDEIERIKSKKLPKSTAILKLNPFFDEQGLMRVGGRLTNAINMNEKMKHPVILPKKGCNQILQWYHNESHSGRTSLINSLRQDGYWVLSVNSQVKKLIYFCIRCRFLRGRLGEQLMGNLPESRTVVPEAPFTHCGVDMFGPFLIKEGRKEMKRYCAIFTCFSLRAIHIETTESMDTDSFILALRRFLNRRGPVKSIRSDNGGNFVGTENEYSKELAKMNHNKIKDFLLQKKCDWIEWERNPPYTSHAGGVWERMIKSVRNVFDSLMKEHSGRLNNEQLTTFMTEAECIVNSRPLTVENLSDPESLPITPNQLLTLKSNVVLPPPGIFQKENVYCRKRWKAVQYLANEFWTRWKKEFLASHQLRQKWQSDKRNFSVGDVVLIKDPDLPRNQWSAGRITEAFPGNDGLVRSANIRVPGQQGVVHRSITKLVLLVGSEEQQ